jgi:hypothetical protein
LAFTPMSTTIRIAIFRSRYSLGNLETPTPTIESRLLPRSTRTNWSTMPVTHSRYRIQNSLKRGGKVSLNFTYGSDSTPAPLHYWAVIASCPNLVQVEHRLGSLRALPLHHSVPFQVGHAANEGSLGFNLVKKYRTDLHGIRSH